MEELREILIEVLTKRLRESYLPIAEDYFLRQSDDCLYYDKIEGCYLIYDARKMKFTAKLIADTYDEAVEIFATYTMSGPVA